MSNPKKHTSGVVVSLRQACPACDAAVLATASECPRCELGRPPAGWVPVDTTSAIGQSDERIDDPETASSAPPPVVPVDAAVAAPAPFVLPVTEEPSLNAILVRFFGIFLVSAVVTALLVTLVGMRFLPEKAAPPLAVVPAPVVPVVEPVVPVVADVDTDVDSEGTDPVVVVEAVATVVPEPVVAVEPSPRPEPVPEPVVDDADTEVDVVAVEPVVEPEPAVSRVPEAAQALTGTYIGRADGKSISMELTMGADQLVTAVLRVAGRNGTEVRTVSGTYTLTPDGAADFAVSDRTDDGVIGYSGTISGAAATGIVTVDGRRRGRFSVGR